MAFFLVPIFVILMIALLAIGIGGRKYWALYLLNAIWICGLGLAVYLTLGAWAGSAYSENWAMYGVIFFVWPYTLLVSVAGAIKLFLLRTDHSLHANRNKRMTAACITVLMALSISALLAG